MPQIKIVSPTDGQTILGNKATITFITGDFTVGQDGYIILWLDDDKEEASKASKITGNFEYTLSDLPSGYHKLTLEGIKSNHLSFSPPVKQTVFFTTILPQVPSPTLSPTPFNFFSIVSFINWQQFLIFISLSIIVLGLAVKFTFGKPKNWE